MTSHGWEAYVSEPPNGKPRLLFVGDCWYGSNARSLRDAMIELGCDVTSVDTSDLTGRLSGFGRMRRKVIGRDAEALARVVQERVFGASEARSFDALIAFRALHLSADVLSDLPMMKIHYHPDDSANPYNRSPTYDQAENLYDLHITTKTYNVPEIVARTGQPAHFVWCAYDRRWHRPLRSREPRAKVGFIGTPHPDRTQLIAAVAKAYGKGFAVWGSDWFKHPEVWVRARVRGPAYATQFSESVTFAPLQLGLLNSANRDQHTCRTFEVPAAGGVLVAPATPDHLSLFEDSVEALLYDEEAEVWDLLARAHREPRQMQTMAERAIRRLRTMNNTYEARALEILEIAGVA